jgi:DNA-binding transcriptional MerR regulator
LGFQRSLHLDKAPDAFRTISEVADDLDVPQHVLRFWETRFAQIKPMKRSGGRRYYRREDVELLRGIRHLLYGQGYTIRGVQRILREHGVKAVQGFDSGAALRQPVAAAAEHDGEADELGYSPESELDTVATLQPRNRDVTGLVAPSVVAARVAPAARPPAQPTAAAPKRLSVDNADLLRGALDDLLACRQLLAAAQSR